MVGWLDGWLAERRSDREDRGLVLALSLGDRFNGRMRSWLRMGGGCLRERVCTAVGWLRVAEWCWLGLLRLVLGVGLRQAWEQLAWASRRRLGCGGCAGCGPG